MDNQTRIPETFLTHSSEILGDTNDGLTWTMIVKFFRAKSIDLNTDIPYSEDIFPSDKLPNKRTGLLKNLQAFSPENQFDIISELCDDTRLRNKDKSAELKALLISRYNHLSKVKVQIINNKIITDTKSLLDSYPDSKKVYESALEKYKNKIYQRNLIDDLRLALELLLKSVLNNQKSLENQLSFLGNYQSDKGASVELKNMFVKLIEYYTKYQNSKIKHNDLVNLDEIDLILELTTSFMKYLLNLNNK